MSDEDSIDAFLRVLEQGIRDSGFGDLGEGAPHEKSAHPKEWGMATKLDQDCAKRTGDMA